MNINAVNQGGRIPFHLAVGNKWLKGIEALLCGGVNVHAQDNHSETPLDLAENEEIRDLLK
ncbi:MAG: hypothetical protein LBJ71_04335 [Holosporaceae bacterium]|jgi:ankyrin repeat protein|nr:hypothetical protein [Holosporaceae bacterium]